MAGHSYREGGGDYFRLKIKCLYLRHICPEADLNYHYVIHQGYFVALLYIISPCNCICMNAKVLAFVCGPIYYEASEYYNIVSTQSFSLRRELVHMICY